MNIGAAMLKLYRKGTYFTIDLDIVWDAVQQDVPLLKPAVVALLKQLETQA